MHIVKDTIVNFLRHFSHAGQRHYPAGASPAAHDCLAQLPNRENRALTESLFLSFFFQFIFFTFF